MNHKLLTSLLIFLTFSLSAQEKKLNVLMLVIDDLNTWLVENPDRYAGKVIAPNINKLAKSGVNFTKAYCASPKCSPSRTSFLSGVAPWKSGVYDNGLNVKASELLNQVKSFPKLFQEAGYFTASFGKISHGYETGVEWDQRMNHNRDPAPPQAPFNGFAKSKSGKLTESDWGPTHLKESEMNDTKYADLAIKALGLKHEKPFFIACGLFHPHMPWYVPQKYFDMYPLDEIVVPPIKDDDHDDIPPLGQKLVKGAYANAIKHNQYKKAVQGYLATTTYADHQMGRVLDALENSPYKDNTLVVLLSDHGFHVGEKKHWQKGTLWEEATNCLLMFRVPGLTKPEQKCQRTVSLLDLYPTLTELAGLPKQSHLDGKSLVPLLKDSNAEWDRPALTAYQSHMSVRTEKLRLIRYTDGTSELYDKAKDPNEWNNQTNNPEYGPIKKKLESYLPAQSDMAGAILGKVRKKKDKKKK